MAVKDRFIFVDQMRGLIIALMGLDHASDYFNSVWSRVEYRDFLFDSFPQFILRMVSYLCAPGFLMLAGAMVWWALERKAAQGAPLWKARGGLMLRGLFLVAVQLVWVNASWGGFARLRLDHFGIIATIGSAIILLALVARWFWWQRLALALGLIALHPLLLRIPYDPGTTDMKMRAMQLLVDAGSWNLYPVLPWFALAVVGSVAGELWFQRWRDDRGRIRNTLLVGMLGVVLFFFARMPAGYGNIMPFDRVGSLSFWFEQKYPPGLAHNMLFPGLVMLFSAAFMAVGVRLRALFHPLEVYGRTPFFFYVVHIPLLAIVTRRLGLLPYRQGEVAAALLAWLGLLIVMYPLCRWFAGVKARSRHPLVKMM
ncbi:MAG: DUF1624 domain-containing protein [Candidatus Eisenbacteria bacterium]|uniref:DUF1624 domain-containing protein n=1 Tax=Eiseniibacteriota bacterium TaxID=2212470 RepID=A0A938BMQ2_UNCEI|nr:DUF1624 domain-containing protein [Candidatus Eisenbacteria bacterium]